MIKKMWIGVFAPVITMVLLSACSVKEDRTSCPCLLTLDFSETDTLNVPSVLIFLDNGTVSYEYALQAGEFMPDVTMNVPKSEISLNIHSGLEENYDLSKGIVIPYGEESPCLYSYCSALDTSGETAREVVEMRKNHCKLTMLFKNEELNPFSLCLKGNVAVYDLSGMPLEGAFSYEMPLAEDGGYKAVLPRQKDTSLLLEIDDGTDVLKRFALGEYLAGGG